jgi:hypothetical protein
MISTTPKFTSAGEALPPAAAGGRAGSTRRRFLLHCSTIFAAAAVAPFGMASLPDHFEMKDISLDDLHYATFAKQAKSLFRVYADADKTVELLLAKAMVSRDTQVKRGKGRGGDAGNEKFSLLFTGPREGLLQQRIYKFEHERIGRFEMFITPVVPKENSRYYYEAVFNRPIKPKRGKLKA